LYSIVGGVGSARFAKCSAEIVVYLSMLFSAPQVTPVIVYPRPQANIFTAFVFTAEINFTVGTKAGE
jgi:hypothetical protein